MRNLVMATALGALVASGAVFASSDGAKAQGCGTYIILGCFGSHSAAEHRRASIGAQWVLHTNDYPNFAPGHYCAADGPYSSGYQEDLQWYKTRTDGHKVSDAYAKAAC